MAIKWFNIRTNESVITESEPQIAAFWASSDHSPNITQGQDFGWRLAPAVVVELNEIKQDYDQLERIARRYKKEVEELQEYDILTYISDRTTIERAPVASRDDYTDSYHKEIARLEKRKAEKAKAKTE